jgi:indole-3-glycerol phosphate synthase
MARDPLADMVARKQHDLEARKQVIPIAALRAMAKLQQRPRDLKLVLKEDPHVSLIAEIKQISPSAGRLLGAYDPVALARTYAAHGARAVAIHTDEAVYGGGLEHLTLVARAVNIPVIRQDFAIDEYQVLEARAAGADGVLLMAELLDDLLLRSLLSLTQRLLMTAVVQVSTESDLRRALLFDPRVIGISNQDMHTYAVDLDTTVRLRSQIPPHIAVISLYGLRTADDVARVTAAGVDGVLVGQALLQAPDTAAKIRELFVSSGHEGDGPI